MTTEKKISEMTGEDFAALKERIAETPSWDGIEVNETPDKVSIEITGAALANIRELQAIINRACDENETATAFVWTELLSGDEWRYLAVKNPPLAIQTCAGLVVDHYEPAEDLEAAFNAAGFSTAR